MTTYFSTFISGFQDIVERELGKKLKTNKVEKMLDGLAIYETSSKIEEVKRIKFFNNSYLLGFLKENINPLFPEKFIRDILKNGNFRFSDDVIGQKKTRFRVVVSKENELVKVNNNLLKEVEDKIQVNNYLVVDRASPEVEFWVVIRREKLGLFGMRITKHKDYKKILDKGELRPELAHLLVLLSEPAKDDVFVDPCAGKAAILSARENYPYKEIRGYDVEPKANRSGFRVLKGDATKLHQLKDGSVDKIVSDPPWGEFNKSSDVGKLYTQTLGEFDRVVKSGGSIILLIAKKEVFEDNLGNFRETLRLEKKYNILVNGKKAGVYKIRKIA